jgi:DUF1365 family protein
VRHRRLGPGLTDEFHYRLFMAYLDLDELPGLFDGRLLWSARRPAPAWFRRADYLGDPDVPLAESVRALVAERTGIRPAGPIRVLTHMRCFGHCFNPVSFYYCFEPGGKRVQSVVADVTNTPWGESHAYVLNLAGRPADAGAVLHGSFPKQLHVSPLMGMEHVYDWRLTEPTERLSVHIESATRPDETPVTGLPGAAATAGGEVAAAATPARVPVFDATLSLARREMSRAQMAGALARYPFLTARIVARIYSHALRLRLRGATYHPHPSRTVPAAPPVAGHSPLRGAGK